MAAAGGALEAALAPKIREYLDVCVYDTARFLAERLVSHVRLCMASHCVLFASRRGFADVVAFPS